jgi:hypothetical protein
MISYEKNFIFVHIYKCAGTSVRVALHPYLRTSKQRMVRWLNKPIGRNIYDVDVLGSHPTANQLKEHLGPREFEKYYTFTFVRNPWDWQVSLYHFMQQTAVHYQHSLISKMSFEEYIDWRCSVEPRSQKRFLVDQHGQNLIDFVGRFESINQDFSTICENLKIDAELPHVNASRRKNYQESYTTETRRKIAETFAEDIEFFGYSFD